MNRLTLTLLLFLTLTSCQEKENQSENEVITITSDWFDVSHVDPSTYIIEEPLSSQGNVSYLIAGTSRAIMFDTGSGENTAINGLKIKPIIDQLTNLPVTLLQSHFHFDHNQNLDEFDHVGFPDLTFLKDKTSVTNIYTYTSDDLFIGDYPAQVEVNEWLPLNEDIDLGGRIIQLVNIPGHTDESIAIIDRTNKMAFLGDYLYNGALFLFDNGDIALYKKSLDYLKSLLDSEYKLFGAHGEPEVSFAYLDKLSTFLSCIEVGDCPSRATELWGYSVLVYESDSMQIVIFQL